MSAQQRVEARRASWSGEVVEAGTPKPSAIAHLDPAQRLVHMAALVRRVWTATGKEMPPTTPRDGWPAEIIDLAHGR